jgi:tetratricopeptide (TPR) repeat protein
MAMAVKFAENFVAYQVDPDQRGVASVELSKVRIALTAAETVASINDLKARQALLEWHVQMEDADTNFNHRRYDDALAGYRAVAKAILVLLEPKVDRVGRPKIWPSGQAISLALSTASTSLLQHLLPEVTDSPPALVLEPPPLDFAAIGAAPVASLTATPTAAQDVEDLTRLAGTAVEQGRWTDAASLYQKALGGLANNPHLEAEVRLNLAVAQVQSGQGQQAVTNLQRAQALFKDANDQVGVAEALHNLGYTQLQMGDPAAATKSLAESRTVAGGATLLGLLQTEAGAPPPPHLPPGGLPHPVLGATIGRASAFNAGLAEIAVGPRFGTHVIPGITTTVTAAAVAATPHDIDVEKSTAELGSADLALKLRPIGHQGPAVDVKLVTPAQRQAENFGRTFTTNLTGAPVSLNWTGQQPLAVADVTDLLQVRTTSTIIAEVGFQPYHTSGTALLLSHLYQCVLPIKMGDCLHAMNQFAAAHDEYVRASQSDVINVPLEAPDLWRRMAQNIADWGDALYRDDLTDAAADVYALLVQPDELAPSSLLYTTPALTPTGQAVTAWLKALHDETPLPELNPAIAQALLTIRKRQVYIAAGLDFFGAIAGAIPPFTFRYLQEAARYFANRAIQAEQRYIEFYARFEQGEMTRRELHNAYEESLQGVDIARQNEQAANATVDAANAAVHLANVRHDGAKQMLDDFNAVAWESEVLSGFIARGNAWTGGDLPNLTYTINGYSYDGRKHEVLQELTQRQTQISNDLQRSRMESTIDEMAAAQTVAATQAAIAVARQRGAVAETRLAEMRRDHAREMRDAFDDQTFNPEQWLAMAQVMSGLAATALDRGIEMGRLMERVYNFENFDSRTVVRSSYKLAATQDLLGGELLLDDIDSFTAYHVTRLNQKPIPVKWAVSLPEEFPGQFLRFAQTGHMEFDIDLERVSLAHPGTYQHMLRGVEIEVDGFLPPTGVHGRLTSSGLGRARDVTGATHLRVQPSETSVLSRYNRRQDSLILSPPPDLRNLFDGSSVASGWTLDIPRSANDVDLRLIFDIRLVLYFECLFDEALFNADAVPPQDLRVERTRALDIRQHYPDAYFQLRETGRARVELTSAQFPLNQTDPKLVSLALAVSTEAGTTLQGATIQVTYPGQANPRPVTVAAGNLVDKSQLPVAADQSALGVYELTLDPAARKDDVVDLYVVMDYRFTPAS